VTTTATRGSARQKRHERIRLTVEGGPARPRLAVFRSLKHIYVQVIDDTAGRTLASASDLDPDVRTTDGTKSDDAARVGTLIARRARAAGVERVVFDRAGFRYHGRIKALADAARAAGLEF